MRRSALLVVLLSIAQPNAWAAKLVSSWVSPEAKGVKFNKALAVAVTRAPATRQFVELLMVQEIGKRGNLAIPSYELLTELELEDVALAKTKVASSGADGAIVLRLRDSSSSERTVATLGSEQTPFWTSYQAVTELTYTQRAIQVEVLIYSLKDEKLLWSGVYVFKDPEGPRKVIPELTKLVVQQLKKNGLVAK